MQKKTQIYIGVLIVISVLIFLLSNLAPFKFISGVVESVFSVPKGMIYGAKASIPEEESEPIKKLRDENASLIKKLSDFEKTKRDNEALRSQFETGMTLKFEMMPAKVIGYLGRFSFPLTLVIDQGENSGIKKGMAVVSNDNLVGKVGKVSPNYSEIELVVNSKFSVLARTAEGSVLGIAKGADDFILFDQAPISEKITVGEALLTKGEIENGLGIPEGIVIGKVSSVNKNESLPFQTAKVESRIQFARLENVFVIVGL